MTVPEATTQSLHRIWRRADVMAASLAINVLALALPIAILQTYDRVIRHQSLSTLIVLTLAVTAAGVFEFALRVLRARIMSAEGARYDHRENTGALGRLLATDIVAFKKDAAGTHAEQFQAIQAVRTFYCQAGALLADVPFLFVFLALIAVIAGWMVVVPLFLFAAFGALGVFAARKLMIETGRREQGDVKRHNLLIEAIGGIATVKALGLEAVMQRRHERLQEECADAFGAIARVTAHMQSIASELAQAASILTVVAGAVAVVNGALTVGGLAATTILTGRLLQPVLKGLGLWARYPFIRLAEQKIQRMDDMTPIIAGTQPLSRRNAPLTFDKVSFRYEGGDRDVVSNVSLFVPPRAYIGITGNTSSGRSTLLKLASGLLTPTAGSIRYDDVPLCLYDPQEMRRQIALMPASPTIYAGTFLENLTLFEDGAVKRRALALCRVLGLENYVARLNRGLETPLSGVGDTPSGVAQQISIARLLARKPRVVLFDTANAALDHDADKRLLDYFTRRKGRLAAVFVTDRPSYLRICDTIYEMVDGRLTLRTQAALEGSRHATVGLRA